MKGKIFSYGSVGWGTILLIVLSVFIFYSNCTKNSTRYEYRREYYLYSSNLGGTEPEQLIYVFSTRTDSLVDSISLGPYRWPEELALSPDKRTLYVRVALFDTLTHSGTRTYYEVDTRTKVIKYFGENSSTIVSPDGKYLFWPYTLLELRIFNACSHQLIYAETTTFTFKPFCFDKKSTLLYGGVRGVPNEIKVFNYESKRWVRSFKIILRDGWAPRLTDAVLSPDGNTLYLLAYYDYIYFLAYDLTRDSLLVQLNINGSGQLAIKPDGSRVYITDNGGAGPCITFEPPPTGKLGVFDTETNTPLPGIDLNPLSDSLCEPPINAYYIEITPNGEKAYLSMCFDRILVIDLLRNEPLKAIIIPRHRNFALVYMAL